MRGENNENVLPKANKKSSLNRTISPREDAAVEKKLGSKVAEKRAARLGDAVREVFTNPEDGYSVRDLDITTAPNAAAVGSKFDTGGDVIGNSEDTALAINFKTTRGKILSKVSQAIAREADDDLLLIEKLETVLLDHQDSLFGIQRAESSYNYPDRWRLTISEEGLERFLEALKRKTVLHKSKQDLL
jgi:hypothetical protein